MRMRYKMTHLSTAAAQSRLLNQYIAAPHCFGSRWRRPFARTRPCGGGQEMQGLTKGRLRTAKCTDKLGAHQVQQRAGVFAAMGRSLHHGWRLLLWMRIALCVCEGAGSA